MSLIIGVSEITQLTFNLLCNLLLTELQNARSGRINGKVSDEQLIDLIDQLNERKTTATSVTFQRKNLVDSDDDIDLDELF